MLRSMLCVVILFVLSHLATAAGKSVVAHFDDLKPLTNGAEGLPITTPYRFLHFYGFSLGKAAPVSAVTLRPSSLKNFAYDSAVSAHTITRKYKGSRVKSFDLHSLSTGCYPGTRNGIVAPPLNCTFTFVGFKVGGGKVRATFDYGVGESDGIGKQSQPVKPFNFPVTFKGLDHVSISVAKSVLPPAGGNVVQFAIDDVSYTVYQR